MKTLSCATVLLSASLMGLNQAAYASVNLDEADANLLFGQGAQTIEAVALAEQEMVETEGAVLGFIATIGNWSARGYNAIRPIFSGAGVGATTGAVNYTASWGASQFSDNPQDFSQPQFWASTAGGAIGGPIGSRWGTAGNIAGGGLGSSVSGYYGNNNYGNSSNNFGLDVGSYCGACYNYPNNR